MLAHLITMEMLIALNVNQVSIYLQINVFHAGMDAQAALVAHSLAQYNAINVHMDYLLCKIYAWIPTN
jgi:hypothetical protein